MMDRFYLFGSIALLVSMVVVVFSSCSMSAALKSSADSVECSVVRVVDGDTLVVDLDGSEKKVRLIGIDTPESVSSNENENCIEGELASEYTKSLVSQGSRVWLEKDVSDTDKYKRLLRYVWLDDPASANAQNAMLNAILVADGYAQAKAFEPDIKYKELFEELGRKAIKANVGLTYKWS